MKSGSVLSLRCRNKTPFQDLLPVWVDPFYTKVKIAELNIKCKILFADLRKGLSAGIFSEQQQSVFYLNCLELPMLQGFLA